MATRPAGKAGSWYSGVAHELMDQLRRNMADVPNTIDGKALPISGARIIIAPHAGYDWSGPCAAWAYKCLDLSNIKRVFVLGPSHTYYLEGCAATAFGKYATPFGSLTVDQDVVQRLKATAAMVDINRSNDIREHSLEMHMPYLYFRCQETFNSPDQFPKIVPILVGDNNGREEKVFGRALLSYLKDPRNAFIVSSDFCHWGKHFNYMVYSPTNDPKNMVRLRSSDRRPSGPPIHETIRLIDELAMDAVKSGMHDKFLDTLKLTQNTVCGRHPIGVIMAALELLAKEPGYEGKGRFSITQYRRSELVEIPTQASVSYVSAYALA